jgi:hypothetical protein
MGYYVGLDVSLKITAICAVDGVRVRKPGRQPSIHDSVQTSPGRRSFGSMSRDQGYRV